MEVVEKESNNQQALLELEPPSGPVFPTLCGGENGHAIRTESQ